jgi:hypothetical protein
MRTPALVVATLFLLTGSGAYAQQVSYYSYGVADDNNAYAWAVIDDGGMYGEIHTPGQSVSLRSPSGRTTGFVSSQSYRIDLSLPLEGEYGNFTITSYHSLYCTYLGWILYQVASAYAIDVPPLFHVSMRAFIPERLLEVPLWCWYNGQLITMQFSGDNRWFDPIDGSPFGPTSYRAQTTTIVRPSDGIMFSAATHHRTGVTKGYGFDPGIDDYYLNDCYRLDRVGYGDPSWMRASGSPVGPITNRTVRARLYGAAYSTGAPLPGIDYDFTVDIQAYPGYPQIFARHPGVHDCYPAYEIYIRRRRDGPATTVYQYAPPRRDWAYLIGCLETYNPYYPRVQVGTHADVIP